MAILKQDIEILSPVKGDGQNDRISSMQFYGYKNGEYTNDDVSHRMGRIVANHDGSSNDSKGKISIQTNDDASVRGTVSHYSGYSISHGDSDITLSGSYQGDRQSSTFTLYLQNNVGGYHTGVEHDTSNQYSVSATGFGNVDEITYVVYDFDTTTFFTVDIYDGIKATWNNSTFGVGVRYTITYNLASSTLYANGDFVSEGKIVSEGNVYVPKITTPGGVILNTYS